MPTKYKSSCLLCFIFISAISPPICMRNPPTNQHSYDCPDDSEHPADHTRLNRRPDYRPSESPLPFLLRANVHRAFLVELGLQVCQIIVGDFSENTRIHFGKTFIPSLFL